MSKLWYAIPVTLLLGLVFIMYAVVVSVVTAPSKIVAQYTGYQGESVTFIYFNNYICKDCVAVEIDGYYEYTLGGYVYNNNKIDLSSSQIKIR
jgi:hypothetical protein